MFFFVFCCGMPGISRMFGGAGAGATSGPPGGIDLPPALLQAPSPERKKKPRGVAKETRLLQALPVELWIQFGLAGLKEMRVFPVNPIPNTTCLGCTCSRSGQGWPFTAKRSKRCSADKSAGLVNSCRDLQAPSASLGPAPLPQQGHV